MPYVHISRLGRLASTARQDEIIFPPTLRHKQRKQKLGAPTGLVVTLPPPKILVQSIDQSRSQVFAENVPWFGQLKAATVENVQRFVLKDA